MFVYGAYMKHWYPTDVAWGWRVCTWLLYFKSKTVYQTLLIHSSLTIPAYLNLSLALCQNTSLHILTCTGLNKK